MLDVLKDGFSRAFRKPITWVALVALPLIIALFAVMYVYTYQDPYTQMKSLPVAVINCDAGAEVNGEQENYGQTLVDAIMDNDSADWVEEDASIVDGGLENTDYFMAIIVPEDFSQRVAAGQTKEPEQANITFYKNARKNYMMSTLSTRVESALESTVNSMISKQYITAYLDGLSSAADGFSTASDGAGELADGLSSAVDGSEQVGSGADSLNSGAQTLSSGLGQLQSGANSLGSGLESLNSGAASLAQGTVTLSSSLNALNAQSSSLSGASSQIGSGLSSLASGADSLSSTVDSKMAAISGQFGGDPSANVAALQASYAAALQAYTKAVAQATATGANPAEVDSSALNSAVANLASCSSAAGSYGALAALQEPVSKISSSAQTLSNGYDNFSSGLDAYTTAVGQISAGAANASSGASELASGAQSAVTGAQQLSSATESAYSGSVQLQQGAAALAEGSQSLTDGLTNAHDGSSTLEESLGDGASTIHDALTADTDDLAEYVATPISMEDEVYGDLDKFGFGFAPLFMTLAMWIGSLALFFVFDPFPSREKLGCSRVAAVFGRWPLYLTMVAMMVIAILIADAVIGLQVTSWPLLALQLGVTAFAFMCMQQLLNLFGLPGKAISVLMVVLQLVWCSATFPAQLGNAIAQTMGPWLPFYYSIDGLREVLSGGVTANVCSDLGCLLGMAAGAVVLSLLAYPLGLKIKKKQDAMALEELAGDSAVANTAA